MLVVTLAGVREDIKDGEPRWFSALGLANGFACALFVFNYFGLTRLGNLAPLAAVVLVGLVYETWRDVQGLKEFTPLELGIVLAVTLGIHVPATVLGMWQPIG